MLYTILGTDIEKVRARSRALTTALQEKRADASFFRLHQENFSPDRLTELLGSVGLFSSKYIVLLDNLLTGVASSGSSSDGSESEVNSEKGSEKKDAASLIRSSLELIKKSEHVWVIVEDAIFGQSTGTELGVRATKDLADIKKELEKFSDKLETHDIAGMGGSKQKGAYGAKPGQVTSFAFTDAFFDKNKILALKALADLEDQGVVQEEIHGALWWQAKVLFQVQAGEDKKVSPFVVGKSKRFLKKWSEGELNKVSDKIIESYHLAHLGKTDLGDELMRLVLRFC